MSRYKIFERKPDWLKRSAINSVRIIKWQEWKPRHTSKQSVCKLVYLVHPVNLQPAKDQVKAAVPLKIPSVLSFLTSFRQWYISNTDSFIQTSRGHINNHLDCSDDWGILFYPLHRYVKLKEIIKEKKGPTIKCLFKKGFVFFYLLSLTRSVSESNPMIILSTYQSQYVLETQYN